MSVLPVRIKLIHLLETTNFDCDVCGCRADYMICLGQIERSFCERDVMDVLLDAMNFAVRELGFPAAVG